MAYSLRLLCLRLLAKFRSFDEIFFAAFSVVASQVIQSMSGLRIRASSRFSSFLTSNTEDEQQLLMAKRLVTVAQNCHVFPFS